MRIVLDYMYANQIVGFIVTIALVLGIIALITKAGPNRSVASLPPAKRYAYWTVIALAIGLCALLVVQISFMPFALGRAGTIRQVAILDRSVAFVDQYSLAGLELGDTPAMVRLWILDRRTGKLLARMRVDADYPILAANGSSLLVMDDGNCRTIDDRGNVTARLVEDGTHRGREVHGFSFTDGALMLSMKDFSKVRVPMPFSQGNKSSQQDIELRYLDTDRDTYRVSRRAGGRTVWEINQSAGALRGRIPDIVYEDPSSDLYLLWTKWRLLAVSKETGAIAWSFLY